MQNRLSRPRVHLTDEILVRLQHLAIDLHRPLGSLVADGAVLFLQLHGRADGLPEPTPAPVTRGPSPESANDGGTP
jgi:hypothetical protein